MRLLDSFNLTVNPRYIPPCRHVVWRALAIRFGVALPPAKSVCTRLSANLKKALFTGVTTKRTVISHKTDRVIWSLWMRLHQCDAAAEAGRQLCGLDVNHRLSFFHDRTALMLASWRGRPRTVRRLIALGANPTLRDSLGSTALIMAAWAGHCRIVQLLIPVMSTHPESLAFQGVSFLAFVTDY